MNVWSKPNGAKEFCHDSKSQRTLGMYTGGGTGTVVRPPGGVPAGGAVLAGYGVPIRFFGGAAGIAATDAGSPNGPAE